jgi:hypothetical protein
VTPQVLFRAVSGVVILVTPLGHLAIATLTAATLAYRRRSAVWCLSGAVLPDLIDKPLAAAGLVEVAHTVGHSVVILALGGLALALRRGRPPAGRALWAGWAGHVGADLLVAYPRFLVNYGWPLLDARPTPDVPVVAYWVEYALGPLGALELLAACTAAVVVGRTRRHSTEIDRPPESPP